MLNVFSTIGRCYVWNELLVENLECFLRDSGFVAGMIISRHVNYSK